MRYDPFPLRRLIRTGPYLLLRHPSYTGTILSFAGGGYFAGLRSWTLIAPFVTILTGVFCKTLRVHTCLAMAALCAMRYCHSKTFLFLPEAHRIQLSCDYTTNGSALYTNRLDMRLEYQNNTYRADTEYCQNR